MRVGTWHQVACVPNVRGSLAEADKRTVRRLCCDSACMATTLFTSSPLTCAAAHTHTHTKHKSLYTPNQGHEVDRANFDVFPPCACIGCLDTCAGTHCSSPPLPPHPCAPTRGVGAPASHKSLKCLFPALDEWSANGRVVVYEVGELGTKPSGKRCMQGGGGEGVLVHIVNCQLRTEHSTL